MSKKTKTSNGRSSPLRNKSRTSQTVKTAKKRTLSSQKWLKRHINDPYVTSAKEENYRSRAAYKLLESEAKYHIISSSPSSTVILDLGCAPGSWLQVLSYLIFEQYDGEDHSLSSNSKNEFITKSEVKNFENLLQAPGSDYANLDSSPNFFIENKNINLELDPLLSTTLHKYSNDEAKDTINRVNLQNTEIINIFKDNDIYSDNFLSKKSYILNNAEFNLENNLNNEQKSHENDFYAKKLSRKNDGVRELSLANKKSDPQPCHQYDSDLVQKYAKQKKNLLKKGDVVFRYIDKISASIKQNNIDNQKKREKEQTKALIPNSKKIYRRHRYRQIIGLDLQNIEQPIAHTRTLVDDFTNPDVAQKIISITQTKKIGVILSDMAPSSSGSKSLDQVRMNELLDHLFTFAEKYLAPEGNMLCKLLNNGDTSLVIKRAKEIFFEVKLFKPNSSYKDSAEIFLVCLKRK